jgi:hypothetical protein
MINTNEVYLSPLQAYKHHPSTSQRPLSSRSPSSSPPLTPPPLNYSRSPYARSPLPPVPEECYPCSPPSINRVLRYALKPSIIFNLLHHPSTVTTLPDYCPLSHHTLSEPATHPPLPRITIISPHLPWSITVTSSLPNMANSFVTVTDVLVTLHRTLNLFTTPGEYKKIPSEEMMTRVNAAYERRLKDTAGWGQRCEGVKRVDFLMGRHRFSGLSTMGKEPTIFVLNVI